MTLEPPAHLSSPSSSVLSSLRKDPQSRSLVISNCSPTLSNIEAPSNRVHVGENFTFLCLPPPFRLQNYFPAMYRDPRELNTVYDRIPAHIFNTLLLLWRRCVYTTLPPSALSQGELRQRGTSDDTVYGHFATSPIVKSFPGFDP